MPALSARARTPSLRTFATRSNLRAAATAGIGAALALGVLLAARRLAGGMTTVLPTPHLLVVAAIIGGAVFASRAAWRLAGPPSADRTEQWLELFLGWGGSVAIVLVLIGCSYPGTHLSHWLLWTPLVIADQILLRAFFTAARPAVVSPRSPSPELELAILAGRAPDDEQILQQLTRLRDAAGAELVRGTLRADFVERQRHATLHVGFCPPLAALPQVDAEPVDGPDATVKIVQALAHGARLEVRLEEPADEPCHVLIDFAAAPSPGGTPESAKGVADPAGTSPRDRQTSG